MTNPATDSTNQEDSIQGAPTGPSGRLPQPLPHSSTHWEPISERRGFYNEQDCLHPSSNLSNKLLKDRKEDVVIFKYRLFPDLLSLEHGDGDGERHGSDTGDGSGKGDSGGKASGSSSEISDLADDVFFRMPRDELVESEQFKEITGPREQPRVLGIIDFPQCYDTSDPTILQSMADELLPEEIRPEFAESHSKSVGELPGQACFRTGILLRAPLGRELDPHKTHPKARYMLFVSFPYLGKEKTKDQLDDNSDNESEVQLGPNSESARLLRFRLLGGGAPIPKGVQEGVGHLGLLLVHQARYMIFDNHTMATFRSKEDTSNDQVPLHPLQKRIGAFCATIHMIANRIDSELVAAEKLQICLRELEETIDKIISSPGAYKSGQEQGRDSEQKYLQKGQRRDLLKKLNRHSVALFAVIMVAERQIELLRDLHIVFSTIYPVATGCYRGSQPGGSCFYQNISPNSTLSESPRNIIHSTTLGTIDQLIRERVLFIQKIKVLAENADNRRGIFFEFLKSENDAKVESELGSHGTKLSGFTLVTAAFLPLNFFATYFANGNMKDFLDDPISQRYFWRVTGPVCGAVILITAVILLWENYFARIYAATLKGVLEACFGKKQARLSQLPKKFDLENQRHKPCPPEGSTPGSPQETAAILESEEIVALQKA